MELVVLVQYAQDTTISPYSELNELGSVPWVPFQYHPLTYIYVNQLYG